MNQPANIPEMEIETYLVAIMAATGILASTGLNASGTPSLSVQQGSVGRKGTSYLDQHSQSTLLTAAPG